MERPKIINLALESIEQQVKSLSSNGMYSHYFTPDEKIELEAVIHKISKIRLPIFVREQKEV